ncbi:MAG: S8 family serine peptidase [Candidatus Marinimicrobia bacterium]|nr:S8 family serine peptidase [Candidatus Neomarinimicrobiota bacterium]
MKTSRTRVFLCIFIAILMVTVSLTAATNVATYNGKEIRSNRIVVVNNSVLQKTTVKAGQTARLESTRQTFQGRTVRQIRGQGIAEWEIKGDMQKALNALNAIEGVSAFPNFVFKREDIKRTSIIGLPTFPTDDPYLKYQWALNNDGTIDSLFFTDFEYNIGGDAEPGADISAFDAWNVTTGGTYPVEGGGTEDIIVAIYDDGIDINHEDLRNNIWINPGEDINNDGIIDDSDWNGVDDDGNGFIDDFWGWNVMNDDNSYLNSGSFHGTHVAGIIGAEGNNALGIAGVNHHIKMLSVLIWDDWGETDAITIMYGYYYLSTLLRSGVKIVAVNQSWGGGGYLYDRDDQRFVDVMTNYAREHDEYGMIWVCSAGNDYENTDKLDYYAYPRLIQSPNIINVGATDYFEMRSDFSNYGLATVDIGAPGIDIASTLPYNEYDLMSGTSMAAPHVTGVIALAKSVFPQDDAHALIARVMATADRLSNYNDLWQTEGRLNAFAAVDPTATLTNYPVSANPAHIQKNFADDYGVNTVGFVNATASAVNVTAAAISGAQASYFSLPAITFPISVVAGGAFGLPVQFVSDSMVDSPYNATLTLTTSAGDVAIPLVGIEQGYSEMAVEPEIDEMGVVHYGDTLTSTFTIANTGEAELEYHLFQYLLGPVDEPIFSPENLNTFKPKTALLNKTPKNKSEMIQADFDKIAPALKDLDRSKITLDFSQAVESGTDPYILWADSLNDSSATMANWTLMAYGSDEGANETWRLFDISETETKDFVFLAGDFDNGYKNNTIAVAASPLFDFTPTADGKVPAYLAFDYAALLELGCDYFYVNVIVDGERWGTILETEYELWSDGYQYRAYADISELVGMQNVEFWFILNTDYSYVEGFGALFDNVEIGLMDAPYFASNYQGTIAPAGQVSVTSTIRTDLLDLGEYILVNYVESNALYNWLGLNLVHFNSVIGHLSVNPVESELGSFYRSQTANSNFNLINDGVVDVEFSSEWYIQNNYYDEEDRPEFLLFGDAVAEAKLNSADKSSAKKDGVRVKPSERIKKVAERYANTQKIAKNATQPVQSVKTALTSKIFRPETVGTAGPLLAENFEASLEMPTGWTIEDWSFGLGDAWHIEHIEQVGFNGNALYFGDPTDWQYYANSETYANSPMIDVSAIPDSESISLEFDYACYVEEDYDYFDLYVGIVVTEDPLDIYWMWIASTEWRDFINDGELHSISFNLSNLTNWLTYNKLIFCFGAWTDGSVGDGGILVDNVSLSTKYRNVYVSPLYGTIKAGETLPIKQHINMQHLMPGDYVMGTEFWYEYYLDNYEWWDEGQAQQWSAFSVLNHKPVAIDDTLNVLAGDTVNAWIVIADAMANDYDEDQDEIFIWNTTDPIYGAFKQTSLIKDGDDEHDNPMYYSYVAPLNYDGFDSFEYQISDGFDTDNGKVTIRIANKPHFVTGTQQEYTFLEDTTLVLNTMRLVPGVGGVDKELYVWGKTKGTLVKIDADKVNRRLTISTKTPDAWGQESVMLYVGHTDKPVDSLKVTVVVVPVNDPPTASFAVAKTNNTVTFTDQSTDARDSEGAIVEWLWDFGDGETSADQNPVHIYKAVNTYTVILTVKDNGNASAATTQEVEVSNIVGIAGQVALPEKFELSQNFPNPFNPSTTIRYALPERSKVRLTIYNMLGKEVRTLVNTVEDAGYKSIIWDGLDQRGQLISTGVYIYKIQAGDFTQTRKMVFMK